MEVGGTFLWTVPWTVHAIPPVCPMIGQRARHGRGLPPGCGIGACKGRSGVAHRGSVHLPTNHRAAGPQGRRDDQTGRGALRPSRPSALISWKRSLQPCMRYRFCLSRTFADVAWPRRGTNRQKIQASTCVLKRLKKCPIFLSERHVLHREFGLIIS